MSDWRSMLQGLGLKITPQRLLVLETLSALGDEAHPDAEQLWKAVKARQPELTKATVYRILKQLAERGAVNELYLRDGRARYELNTEHHHHFVCLSCRQTEKIAACSMPALSLENPPRRIISHHLELFGYCPACVQNQEGGLAHA